jgi:hypothetical protein
MLERSGTASGSLACSSGQPRRVPFSAILAIFAQRLEKGKVGAPQTDGSSSSVSDMERRQKSSF